MKPEDLAKLETPHWTVGRERPGSWHELLARQKAINDAHDKVIELDRSEYQDKGLR